MTLQYGREASYIVGVTNNFCCEGFSFISQDVELMTNEPVEFRMKLPNRGRYTRVMGNIAWKRRIRDRCMAGVKTRYLEDAVKREILDYTYSRWIAGVRFQ
jgi:hypothetical protein